MPSRALIPRECARHGVEWHSTASRRERDSFRFKVRGKPEMTRDGKMKSALQQEYDFEGPKPRK
eukprot:8535912-Pyramimonas_sp.AAC.1